VAGFLEGFTADGDIRARSEDLFRRYPDLEAIAERDPHIRRIALESPEQLEGYREAYDARLRSSNPPKHGFAAYVHARQVTYERSAFGESTLAAQRARAGEVVLTDLGRPNERGIDLVTYSPRDDRIKLLDDKSWSRTVDEVGALDRNLVVNLERAIKELARHEVEVAFFGDFFAEAITRLSLAREQLVEIRAQRQQEVVNLLTNLQIDHVDARDPNLLQALADEARKLAENEAPSADDDTDDALARLLVAHDELMTIQTRYDERVKAVLAGLGIDRVVTNTVGPGQPAITEQLEKKGFTVETGPSRPAASGG
jgi:hypothetical protein